MNYLNSSSLVEGTAGAAAISRADRGIKVQKIDTGELLLSIKASRRLLVSFYYQNWLVESFNIDCNKSGSLKLFWQLDWLQKHD